MLHRDRREFAAALRTLPERHVATLDPRHRLARSCSSSRKRDGVEPAGADVVLDSRERAVSVVWKRALEELPQRVVSSRPRVGSRRSMPPPPTSRIPQRPMLREQRQCMDVVDLVRREAEPEANELLGGFRQWCRLRGQERRVDRAGGDAGEDGKPQRRVAPGDGAQHAGLVRAPRPAAAEHEGERCR